jgi:hypothetical protein
MRSLVKLLKNIAGWIVLTVAIILVVVVVCAIIGLCIGIVFKVIAMVVGG